MTMITNNVLMPSDDDNNPSSKKDTTKHPADNSSVRNRIPAPDAANETTNASSRAKTVSLNTLLEKLRHDFYHGSAPVEYAIANEPWGTLALRPGDVLGLAAPPGMGKTSLVSQLTDNALRLNASAVCLHANVEMLPATLIERKMANLSGVPYADIASRQGLLGHQHQIDPAFATLADIGDRMFFMGQPYSLEHLSAAILQTKPTIVVLDYLQRIECCDGVADSRNRLNTVMQEARVIASAGIAVVLVSAVARTPSKKGGGYNSKEIGMGSFRESSEIEYGCDDAFVMVEEENSETSDGCRVVVLRHVKSRNHKRHDLRLKFDGAIQRFHKLPDQKDNEEKAGPLANGYGSTDGTTSKKPKRLAGDFFIDPWNSGLPGEGE
jgi:replicative DNA helicase